MEECVDACMPLLAPIHLQGSASASEHQHVQRPSQHCSCIWKRGPPYIMGARPASSHLVSLRQWAGSEPEAVGLQ